ncbi:MarP family serine protease [Lacisediminihabitans profunda]|uniref:MarP family serine protease n=1 Tax=Lacisediminihabitans profunda TaxID=2594790 RepID=A0A5C8UT74_9MICO|nr:MarP family serine protease [Lacisediminihabitans profunda]TXN31482.1 MarP family serine protease [Lacisediminihabitans profunda]
MTGSLVLDVILCILLLAYTVHGFRAGFVLSITGIAGFIAGAVVAFFAIPLIASWVTSSQWRLPLILLAVVVLIGLGQAAGTLIGRALRRGVDRTPLRILDRVFGAMVTLVVAAVVTSMLAFGIGSLGVPFVSSAISSSAVVQTIDRVTPDPVKALEAQVRGLVAQDGLPRLFEAIGSNTNIPVPAAGAGTAAQQAAAASVVKIVGNAYQCGQNQSGSGYVAAKGRIITNAHVVAGVTEPVVQTPSGGSYTGRVVFFDGVHDLAVIAVDGLTTRVLPLGANLGQGDTAVFDGYPLGGPFSSAPAAVRGVNTVQVPDIYGANPAPREVYYLSADVQEGNSGGPVIDAGGRVAGVIFAKSATTDRLGFAMTTNDLTTVVAKAPSLVSAVSSGHCTRG